jgi:hypothetical protein
MQDESVRKNNLRLAAVWALICIPASEMMLPYLFAYLDLMGRTPPMPDWMLSVGFPLGTAALVYPLVFAGLQLGGSFGLGSPWMRAILMRSPLPFPSRKNILRDMSAAFGMGLLLLAMGKLLMPPVAIERWKCLLCVAGGVIVTELILRVFLTTLAARILMLFGRNKAAFLPGGIAWTSIFPVAALYGIGHLPIAAALWGGAPVPRALIAVLNAAPGIVGGFFYWRRGIEYGMLAHVCTDLAIHGLGGM